MNWTQIEKDAERQLKLVEMAERTLGRVQMPDPGIVRMMEQNARLAKDLAPLREAARVSAGVEPAIKAGLGAEKTGAALAAGQIAETVRKVGLDTKPIAALTPVKPPSAQLKTFASVNLPPLKAAFSPAVEKSLEARSGAVRDMILDHAKSSFIPVIERINREFSTAVGSSLSQIMKPGGPLSPRVQNMFPKMPLVSLPRHVVDPFYRALKKAEPALRLLGEILDHPLAFEARIAYEAATERGNHKRMELFLTRTLGLSIKPEHRSLYLKVAEDYIAQALDDPFGTMAKWTVRATYSQGRNYLRVTITDKAWKIIRAATEVSDDDKVRFEEFNADEHSDFFDAREGDPQLIVVRNELDLVYREHLRELAYVVKELENNKNEDHSFLSVVVTEAIESDEESNLKHEDLAGLVGGRYHVVQNFDRKARNAARKKGVLWKGPY